MNTFTKIKHDTNGNPRFVCSWLGWGFACYADAIRAANTLGGRKYHTKSYGGGLVFQAYECELADIAQKMKDFPK